MKRALALLLLLAPPLAAAQEPEARDETTLPATPVGSHAAGTALVVVFSAPVTLTGCPVTSSVVIAAYRGGECTDSKAAPSGAAGALVSSATGARVAVGYRAAPLPALFPRPAIVTYNVTTGGLLQPWENTPRETAAEVAVTAEGRAAALVGNRVLVYDATGAQALEVQLNDEELTALEAGPFGFVAATWNGTRSQLHRFHTNCCTRATLAPGAGLVEILEPGPDAMWGLTDAPAILRDPGGTPQTAPVPNGTAALAVAADRVAHGNGTRLTIATAAFPPAPVADVALGATAVQPVAGGFIAVTDENVTGFGPDGTIAWSLEGNGTVALAGEDLYVVSGATIRRYDGAARVQVTAAPLTLAPGGTFDATLTLAAQGATGATARLEFLPPAWLSVTPANLTQDLALGARRNVTVRVSADDGAPAGNHTIRINGTPAVNGTFTVRVLPVGAIRLEPPGEPIPLAVGNNTVTVTVVNTRNTRVGVSLGASDNQNWLAGPPEPETAILEAQARLPATLRIRVPAGAAEGTTDLIRVVVRTEDGLTIDRTLRSILNPVARLVLPDPLLTSIVRPGGEANPLLRIRNEGTIPATGTLLIFQESAAGRVLPRELVLEHPRNVTVGPNQEILVPLTITAGRNATANQTIALTVLVTSATGDESTSRLLVTIEPPPAEPRNDTPLPGALLLLPFLVLRRRSVTRR